ncbi:MAG TPA: DNA-processing protein DprA [Pedococcus sp.]
MTRTADEDRVARAALSRLTEPGDLRVRRVVREVGAARVVELLREERDVDGVHTEVAQRLHGIDPERELAEADHQGIRFVCPGDEEWPQRLDDLDRCEPVDRQGGAPLGLWVRGSASLAGAAARSVAVVGSRSATTYGADVAGELGYGLVQDDVTVVSGAAFGIDAAAHRGALAGDGTTVAVLACGVDRAYPAGHQSLLEHVARTGLVVSELPPGCAPTRLRFLTRNRLIAALSLGTVVVEAAVRSGALNTANWAARLGRVLMGVPGPVTSAPSEGVHELIRCREGQLVTRAAHVLELVGAMGADLAPVPRAPESFRDLLPVTERRVLEATPLVQAATTASVARTAGLSVAATSHALEALLAGGAVERRGDSWRLASAMPSAEPAPP